MKKILMLTTGGTIASAPGAQGLAPRGSGEILSHLGAGFAGCEQEVAERFHLSLNARRLPDIPAGTHVLAPGLFVAGDMRAGQSLVVRALADGRAAAMEAHRWLCGEDR